MSSKAVYRARGAMPGARTVSAQCVHPRMGSWHEGHRLEENSPRTSRVGCSPCLTSAFLEVNTSCQDQLLKGDQESELPDDPDTFEPPLAILPLGTPAPHKPSHNPQPFLHGWGGTQRGHHVPEPCHSSHSPSCLFPGLPTPGRPRRHHQRAEHGQGCLLSRGCRAICLICPSLALGRATLGPASLTPLLSHSHPRPARVTAQARPFHQCSAFG